MAPDSKLEIVIKRCKAGESAGFSDLIDIYSKRLYSYFYRLSSSRDISDDLLSELFLKLVEKIRSFKSDNFDGWLFKIASNIFYDYLRQKQKQQKITDAGIEKFRQPVSDESPCAYDSLQKQLDKLDTDTRELIVLRFYSGLAFKEIAEVRSEPVGTVLSKVHRGLKKLRDLME